jgi:hypothetical protein
VICRGVTNASWISVEVIGTAKASAAVGAVPCAAVPFDQAGKGDEPPVVGLESREKCRQG